MKIVKIILIIISLFLSVTYTCSYFKSSSIISNFIKSKDYLITINGNGGVYNNSDISINNGRLILPIPVREGYSFGGYTDGINNYSEVVNLNNKEYIAKWSTDRFPSNFYYNNNYITSTYNNFNDRVSTPGIDASSLGLDTRFYYIDAYYDTDGWIQKSYPMIFNISVKGYNCTSSFGNASSNNAKQQLAKVTAAGYNNCYLTSWNSIECTSNGYPELYFNIWNILPRSGAGFSIYKQISCDSGFWATETR